jgi:hypothetical protein
MSGALSSAGKKDGSMLTIIATLLFTMMFAVAMSSILHDLTRPQAPVDRGIALPPLATPVALREVSTRALVERAARRPVRTTAPMRRPAALAAAA